MSELDQVDVYKLYNPCCCRRDLPKGMYVRHDIVSAFLLFLGCDLELLWGEMLYNTPHRRNNFQTRNL
jgi:hypothetical protein